MARSDLTPSVVMYILSVSISEFWGYPKSRISARTEAKQGKAGARSELVSTNEEACVQAKGKTGGRTVEQLIDEDKVVLDALLVELAKVGARDGHEPVDEFEHQGGRGVGSWGRRGNSSLRSAPIVSLDPPRGVKYALGHSEDIDVVDPDVEEGR